MGLAIIVPNADFSSASLGKVTLNQDVPLQSLAIVGESSIDDATVYSVSYIPSNTSQRGVAWSIVSGSQYATINANTGEVTPIEGADSSLVIIKATSTQNPSVSAEKSIQVTAKENIVFYNALKFDGDSGINTGVKVNGLDKYLLDFTYVKKSSTYDVFVGGRDSGSANRRDIQTTSSAMQISVCYDNGDAVVVNNKMNNGSRINLTFDPATGVDVNGTHYASEKTVKSFSTSVDVTLGVQNQPSGYYWSQGSATTSKIHAFKIWREGELILDLVPCTYDGVAGMYDRVKKEFHGNIGSGTLTVE